MKKTGLALLFLSMGIIIFFFVKEQFRGIDLSQTENIILSISYIGWAIAFIILWKIKSRERKNESNNEKPFSKKDRI